MAKWKPIDISKNADEDDLTTEPAQTENESPLPAWQRIKSYLGPVLAFPRLVLHQHHTRHVASVAIAATIGVIVGAATTLGFSHTASTSASVGAETPLPPRVSVLTNWSIRSSRNGYLYVQGHGDVYQAAPGAPLPGLGPVEQIKRQDGHWVVVTPKGIIVSRRDRHYFERL